jgi:hypothetical protein
MFRWRELEGEVLRLGDVVLPTISMFTRPFMGGVFGQLKGLGNFIS